jgi:hypothetical protein
LAVRCQLDVGGLEISMDNPSFVCRLKGLRDLSSDGQRFVERHRPLRNPIGERRSLHQLQYERMDAL